MADGGGKGFGWGTLIAVGLAGAALGVGGTLGVIMLMPAKPKDTNALPPPKK